MLPRLSHHPHKTLLITPCPSPISATQAVSSAVGRELIHPLAQRWGSQQLEGPRLFPLGPSGKTHSSSCCCQETKKVPEVLVMDVKASCAQRHRTGGGLPRMSHPHASSLTPNTPHPHGQQHPQAPSEAPLSLRLTEFRQLSQVSFISEHPERQE